MHESHLSHDFRRVCSETLPKSQKTRVTASLTIASLPIPTRAQACGALGYLDVSGEQSEGLSCQPVLVPRGGGTTMRLFGTGCVLTPLMRRSGAASGAERVSFASAPLEGGDKGDKGLEGNKGDMGELALMAERKLKDFVLFDTDGSGALDRKEMGKLMARG